MRIKIILFFWSHFLFYFAGNCIAEVLSACSFYKPSLSGASFAFGTPFAGCAEFSAVLGRSGCKKTKGPCPLCTVYPGDHLRMWLPDYFVEVTKHIGQSVFTELPTGALLQAHLKRAKDSRDASLGAPSEPHLSSGAHSGSAGSSFWYARILTLPYGAQVNTFNPLKASEGIGFPQCFLGISEYLDAQWNLNLSDAPFVLAWMPIGMQVCTNPLAVPAAELMSKAKGEIAGSLGGFSSAPSSNLSCAMRVGAKEGSLKNALPSSDALAPLRKNPYESLCMGSWGNLLPRTGWINSDDPFMSALMAAYKFQSLAGDFNLNYALKLRSDDKWQIVYPPRLPNTCFKPGSSLSLIGSSDSALARARDELGTNPSLKDHTYVIAVWRKRESCEEPLQYINGWNEAHKAHLEKNAALCAGMGGL